MLIEMTIGEESFTVEVDTKRDGQALTEMLAGACYLGGIHYSSDAEGDLLHVDDAAEFHLENRNMKMEERGWSKEVYRPSLPEIHSSLPIPRSPGFLRKLIAFAGPGFFGLSLAKDFVDSMETIRRMASGAASSAFSKGARAAS